jgi:phospholipase C
MSPSSTADDTGNYGGFGVEGLLFPYYGTGADSSHPSMGLSQCWACAAENTVTPHASFLALSVVPTEAYANIVNLRTLFPDVYRSDGGFYDAVNPTTGAVGHRRLVLDQSMIMAALDNAITHGAMQRHFASDPVARIGLFYLAYEKMSIR